MGANSTKIQPNRGDRSKSFKLFPQLPPELRNKIWTYACLIPRYIDVWEKNFRHIDYGVRFKERSYNNIPSLLHTFSEARRIGLQYYSLEYSYFPEREIRVEAFQINPTAFPKIYVNWICDVICILEYSYGPLTGMLASKPVRFIAATIDFFQYLFHHFNAGEFKLVEELWLFPTPRRLKEIEKLAFEAKPRVILDFIHFDGSLKHLKDNTSGDLTVKKNYCDFEFMTDSRRMKASLMTSPPFWYGTVHKNHSPTVVTKILILTLVQ